MASSFLSSAPRTSSVGTFVRDQRAVVMVEFLVAFMPIFVLFLATIQLALVGAARLIVQHAATVAVRSAAVVIEDDPEAYRGAERRDLGAGAATESGIQAMLGLAEPGSRAAAARAVIHAWTLPPPWGEDSGAQRGARMAAISEAAYVPLLALAPAASNLRHGAADSVVTALQATGLQEAASALEYTRGAAVVTLHSTTTASDPPPRVFPQGGLVTARVTYFYRCGVPLVSFLICQTLEAFREPALESPPTSDSPWNRLDRAASPGWLRAATGRYDRFVALEGRASFPSQTATYTNWGEE